MTESEIKLLCSIPGIESSVFDIVKTLSALVSESADREVRLQNRIGELAMQIKGLNEEVVALKESAIATASVPPTICPAAQQTQRTTKRKGPRSRTRTRTGQDATCTGSEHRSVSRSVRVGTGDTGSDHEMSSEEDESSQTVGCPSVKTLKTKLPRFSEINDDEADADSWQVLTSRKPTAKKSVLFVGNLKPDITESRLTQFVVNRAKRADVDVAVHACKTFPKDGHVSARIVINKSSVELVNSKAFWPQPVYSRSWNFDKYATDSGNDAGTEQGDSDTHGTLPSQQQQHSSEQLVKQPGMPTMSE